MDTRIRKTELMQILRANREAHGKIVEEAWRGYLAEVAKVARRQAKLASQGVRRNLSFTLVVPVDQRKEYDRAIRALELETRDEIELDEREFAEFVMDDWSWKGQWYASNVAYSATLAAQES